MSGDLVKDDVPLCSDMDDEAPSAPQPEIAPIPPPPTQGAYVQAQPQGVYNQAPPPMNEGAYNQAPPPNQGVYNQAPPPAYSADAAAPVSTANTYTAAPGAVHAFPKRANMQSYQPLAQHQQSAYPPQQGYPQQGYPQQGYPQQGYPQQPYPQPQVYPPTAMQQNTSNVTVVTTQPTIQAVHLGTKPESYLILSIFTCLCCCWLTGMIAILYSLQVDSSWAAGDYDSAQRSSRTALYWNIATIVLGIVCGVIAGVLGGITS